MSRFLFGRSWSNVEVIAGLLLATSTLNWWLAALIFLGVVVVNAVMAEVTGANE